MNKVIKETICRIGNPKIKHVICFSSLMESTLWSQHNILNEVRCMFLFLFD